MDYEKKYKEALKRARDVYTYYCDDRQQLIKIESIFPELKESEDEKIRKALIELVGMVDIAPICKAFDIKDSDMLTWLEKQGGTNETINRDEFAQGVLRGAAINLITWIDYNAAEGNMCLSNMECKDIEDALVSGDWDKIYTYMKKKLEKQGDKSVNIDIKSIVNSYKQRLKNQLKNQVGIENNPLINMCLTSFRHGVENVLEELNLKKLEKPQGKSALEAAKEKRIDNQNCVKSADKFEPKFNEEDWVVWQYENYKVNDNSCGYRLVDQNGLSTLLEYATIDENAHLWTIQDAKAGDVLTLSYASQNYILIYKGLHEKNFKTIMSVFCSYCVEGYTYADEADSFHLMNCGEIITPATKKQRDILIKAMTDAGYTFDFNKKKLIKVEDEPNKGGEK